MGALEDNTSLIARVGAGLTAIKNKIKSLGGTVADNTVIEGLPACMDSIPHGGSTVTKTEMNGDYLMYGQYMSNNSRDDDFFEYVSKAIYPTSMNNFASQNNVITKIPVDFDMSHVTGTMYQAFNYCSNLAGTIDFKGAKPTDIGSMFYTSSGSKVQEILNLNLDYITNASPSNKPFPRSFSITFKCALNRLTFDCLQIYHGKFPFDISYCSFTRTTMIEMFNSLPVNDSTNTTYNTITITGNPCVNLIGEQLTADDRDIAIFKGWTLTG